jgi:phosphopantothenoylcysteine decarboxylase/phosphopantothenate--cysteine ligase
LIFCEPAELEKKTDMNESTASKALRILITAGPTREFFDSVRFISNPSTGKMGFALAEVAAARGHHVTLIAGPVELKSPANVEVIRVTTAQEMFDASVSSFERADAAVMTAAVCDYRPAVRLDKKLQKSAQPRTIELLPTRDICAHLGSIKGRRVVIGFAMEDHDHHAHAEAKLKRKNCDAIVLNGPENVGADNATVEILISQTWQEKTQGTKHEIARHIIQLTESLVGQSEPRA